jgi:hypothetical protein
MIHLALWIASAIFLAVVGSFVIAAIWVWVEAVWKAFYDWGMGH